LVSEATNLATIETRGSNPNIDTNQGVTDKQVTTFENSASAHSQQTGDSKWLDLTTIDIKLQQIIQIWPSLNGSQRKRIVDVAIQKQNGSALSTR